MGGEADQPGDREQRGIGQRAIVLVATAVLILLVHVDLAGFEPEPYGTVAIDSDEVELFAPAGGSPLLIFGVSALLFAGQRRAIVAALGAPPNPLVAIPLLAVGACLAIWAGYVGATELLVLSLIASLLGSAAWLGGSRGLRAAAIPACFLIFAFPIPAGIVNLAVWPLQLSAAASSDFLLRATGFASERFGDVVILGDHAFMVIETCSGMRMIETLVMASALYATLFYRRPQQVALLLLAAPIIGYIVNLARVLSIIFNPYSEWSAVHETQGVVMLVIGVLLIAGFDQLLARRDRRLGIAPSPRSEIAPSANENVMGRALSLATVLLVIVGLQWSIEPWKAPRPEALDAFDIPNEIAGSKARGRKLDRQFYGSVGISRWLHREYEFGGEPVAVQILADDRLDRRGSLRSAKTAIPGGGLVERSRDQATLADGKTVDRRFFTGRNQRLLVYHWHEGMDGAFEETFRNALALDRGPARRSGAALSIRLSTPVRESQGALERANRRLAGFAEEMRGGIDRRKPASDTAGDGTSERNAAS